MRTPPQAITSLTNNLLCATSILALALMCISANAANLTWTSSGNATAGGNGNWADGSTWWNGSSGVAWTTGDNATFSAAGNTTVNSAITAGTLAFNSSTANISVLDGAGDLTMNSGITATNSANTAARTFTISESNLLLGASQTWAVNNGGSVGTSNLAVSSVISGAGFGITKTGNGTLTLTGANTFTQPVWVQNGTLAVNGFGNTGSASFLGTNGTIKLGSGSTAVTLSLRNGTPVETTDKVIDLSGSTGAVNITASNATITMSGNLASSAAGAKTLSFSSAGNTNTFNLSYDGLVADGSGTVSLTFGGSGNGNFTLGNANNSFSGPVTINANTASTTTTLSAASFGMSGSDSALGKNGTISIGSSSSTANNILKYTGTGETSDKNINLSGGATGGVAIDQSGASGQLVLTGNITNTGSGTKTLTFQGSTAGTALLNGAIANSSGGNATNVKKAGTGTWILSGANTYTGDTTVSAGTLAGASANAFGSSSIGIAASGTLSLRGDSDTSFVKASDSSAYTIQTSATGATINADQATGGGTAAKTMTIGSLGTVSIAATYQVNFTGANNTSLSLGAVTGSTSTAGGNVTLSNSISGGGGLTLASYTSAATGGPETLIFSGNGNTTVSGAITPSSAVLALTKSGTGTLTLSSNSTYTGSTTISAGTVAFNTNSALGTGAVTLGGALSALATATLSNNISVASAGTLRVGSGNTFTSSGVISGAGAVTKNSGGTLDLSSANTNSFSGGMKINDGTVVVTTIGNAGANSALGTSGTVQLGAGTSAGTIRWDGTADETTDKVIDFAGATTTSSGATLIANAAGRTLTFTSNTTVSGSGNKLLTLGGTGNIAFDGVVANGANATVSLTKSGAGTATLSASNTYTGNTLVSAGTLLVDGSTSASSAVTVNAAATLGGSGTINGATVVNGTLNPGIATTLTLGSNLTFGSGSNLTLTLGTSSSKIAFVSAANNLLGSGNATLNLSQGTGFDYTTTYRIFENTNTANFAFNDIAGYDNAVYTANFAQSGSNYDLSFTAVPEPSTYALLLAVVATLIFARRRKSA